MYWKQVEETDNIFTDQIHGGDGFIKRRSFFQESSKLPIRVQVWQLEKGVSEGDHVHEGVGALEEMYYFLEGVGVMTVDEEEVKVAAGDAIMVPPGTNHGLRSTGDKPLKLVIIWGKQHVENRE